MAMYATGHGDEAMRGGSQAGAAIQVHGLTKRYGDTIAVDHVSLDVETGEIFGVLGRNGAGKTTLVECIAGLREPDAGEMRVLGLDPRRHRARLRQVLGVQLQGAKLPEKLRVSEAVRLYRSFYERGVDPDGLIEQVGLTDKRETAFEDLSGGQQQRLSIALALVGQPRVAILDELTTGLDPEARREMWSRIEAIRAEGVTIVLVTHYMDEAQRLCDRVAIIDRGRVAAMDAPTRLIAQLDGSQRLRVRTDRPFDRQALLALPAVAMVEMRDGAVIIGGRGSLAVEVSSALAEQEVEVVEMSLEQASLEDAFLAITGARPTVPQGGGE